MCCFVCQDFFCFILEIFPKSCCPLSNHVLSSGQLDYNTTRILFCQPFFNTFSLASEQQRLNFTLLWHLVLPKSWFSKWNSFFNPQHTSFFFCLLRLYAFSASIRHFWCQIGQVCSISGWYTFLQPLTSLTERGIKCTIFPLHHPIKIRASKGGFQFWVCQIAQSRDCFCDFGRKLENLSMTVYLQ